MKILSIGNSFSQDAQRYLHGLAKHNGEEMKTVNLYVPGCPLRSHYINVLENNAAYDFEFNGVATGLKVSISQALASDDWDVITLQQASFYSGRYETYSPYIEEVAKFVRKYCPHAKIWIHQTWAYENESQLLKNLQIFERSEDMLAAICDSYAKAAKAIDAYGTIPCGKAMMKATELGIEKIHRDTFHASLGAGRYLLALCWYKAFTGKDISNDTFNEFDVPVTEEERQIVIKAVNSVV
ncbi:MAG: DUF4886 domain-containing protein [Clostridia bacterium]|nr:DUF4886 domain-containing protein [Clostridia bacterium]